MQQFVRLIHPGVVFGRPKVHDLLRLQFSQDAIARWPPVPPEARASRVRQVCNDAFVFQIKMGAGLIARVLKKREDEYMTVEQFFTQYAALSMGDDDRALAAVYAPSFIVGGPKGSMTFANDAQFLDWLVRVRAFNREHGMHALSPAAVRETMLSPMHVLAEVRWSARFEKTGARAIEFDIAYLIERAAESWRVLGYISARDQEAEMRALGLL